MATINEIYQEIIAAKEAQSHLSELDVNASETVAEVISELSKSRVSIWRLWAYIVAFAFWVLGKKLDIQMDEQLHLVQSQKLHSLSWYRNRGLEFQNGKELKWIIDDAGNASFYYEVLPDDNLDELRVVKRCAANESPNKLNIKISGATDPLSPEIELRFNAYMNQIKDAGNVIDVKNLPGDDLKLELDVYVDPLVINPDSGTYVLDPGVNPVADAINEYLASLPFDGTFNRTEVVDKIQLKTGVVDPRLRHAKARYGVISFQEFEDFYLPNSGHFVINELIINYLV